MTANEALSLALEAGSDWLLAIVRDLKGDELLTRPTENGGNHALWVLGHLATSEAAIINGYVLGNANPLKSWEPLFGMGSSPSDNAADYDSVESLLAKFKEVRQATLQTLQEISPEELDAQTGADYPIFSTKGKCFAMMVSHQAFHTGQLSDVRRALGKKPLLG